MDEHPVCSSSSSSSSSLLLLLKWFYVDAHRYEYAVRFEQARRPVVTLYRPRNAISAYPNPTTDRVPIVHLLATIHGGGGDDMDTPFSRRMMMIRAMMATILRNDSDEI